MSKSTELRSGAASVRISRQTYVGVSFLFTFLASFFLYLDIFSLFISCLSFALIAVPYLAFTDRIRFDGKRLVRTGLLSYLARRWFGIPNRIRVNHIEQVDTQAIGAYKRRGRVNYAFRTSVRGRGTTMVFSGAGAKYIRMIKEVFSRLPDDILDNRSTELRDFYLERDVAEGEARRSNIPSNEVLAEMIDQIRVVRPPKVQSEPEESGEKAERVLQLRRLGNQLRVSGALFQAAEAFRRGIRIKPNDGWLLFEFAKCLYSLSVSERDTRIERRAVAMMRLAEKRAGNDAELLSRLGESYFQIGDWRRAGIVFNRVVERFGDSFRSLRGLAELSLREGKIAHVIHNFDAAGRATKVSSVRKWTEQEVEYFSRLNSDDEYMELEISRVNLVDSLARSKAVALRLTAIGVPIVIGGLILQDVLVANVGWAIAGVGVLAWTVMAIMSSMLSSRIPLDSIGHED